MAIDQAVVLAQQNSRFIQLQLSGSDCMTTLEESVNLKLMEKGIVAHLQKINLKDCSSIKAQVYKGSGHKESIQNYQTNNLN